MNVMKLMVVAFAGWIKPQQEDVIDYLREEVRVLKELQGSDSEMTRGENLRARRSSLVMVV